MRSMVNTAPIGTQEYFQFLSTKEVSENSIVVGSYQHVQDSVRLHKLLRQLEESHGEKKDSMYAFLPMKENGQIYAEVRR